MQKTRIAVIFGGKSGEHEVSLVSAKAVIEAIDKEKYEVIEIGIDKNGKWHTGQNCLEAFKKEALEGLKLIGLSTAGAGDFFSQLEGKNLERASENPEKNIQIQQNPLHGKIDIAFPVLHGPNGEDGTIQGLFEMLNIPYVGCGILASSTAMDKLQCKAIWKSAGLPVVPYIGFNRKAWQIEPEIILNDIKENLGFPCFVKPANMGSSVGITKVKKEEDLKTAIDLAAKFDRRLLVEKGLNVREIECAVLGNDDPIASPMGEIIVGGEFYDFHDKYVNGVSSTEVPANIPAETAKKFQEISVKAYKLLDCAGLARVDSFLDRDTGEIYLNELNTMPGFTPISMYSKMMEAGGIAYSKLVERLIELGFERYEDRKKNQVSFESGSDWFKS